MQDQWYADKRDLVKWGSLVHLAREYRIQSILQVAFFRPTKPKHLLSIDGDCHAALAPEVWDHFRDIRQVKCLGRRTGLEIDVFDQDFRNRDAYIRVLTTQIHEYSSASRVVLLDPDTGIAPLKSQPSLKHVLPSEVERIWAVLRTGDVLVLYQHQRRTRKWIAETRGQFADAVKTSQAEVRTIKSACRELASDVAFFAARRERG